MRKKEVPRDTPTEFELGDTAADIHRRREEREQRDREKAQKQKREESEREEAKREETTHSGEWLKSDK